MQKTERKSAKTEQPVNMNFFEALNLLRSENSTLMKVACISEDHAQKIPDHFNFSVKSYKFNGDQQKNCSCVEIQI